MSNILEHDYTDKNKKRKVLDGIVEGAKKRVNIEFKSDQEIILNPILDEKYTDSIYTEKMFVGKIITKKETSRLIYELNNVYPLEGKSHLKRVKWTSEKDIFEIILRPVLPNESVDCVKSFSLKYVIGDSSINLTGLSDTVIVCDIPTHPAWCFRQFKQTASLWPMQFRENKYIEKVLNDQLFSCEEKNTIQKFMRMSLREARNGDEEVGCVIVDPATFKIVAVAHDLRNQHPLKHAVMVAIELVANRQGGTPSWDIESEHDNSPEEREMKVSDSKDVKSSLPYLCTKYDLYVSREPCIMCAMALVHSRIGRVFYAYNTPTGALGSHWKLHLQSGLNHHYEVFRTILSDKVLAFP